MRRSYFVLMSAFSITFMITGSTKSLGVLLPSLKEQLDADTWVIGSLLSILQISGGIIAPFAGIFGRRFTTRYVAVFGGFMVCSSFVSCSAATRPAHLVVPFIIAGIGRRVIKILSMAMVADHFHESFGQAIGFVTCGVSLGVIVMAPVTQFILDTYGLMGALMLLGAINSHLVVCGVLLTPNAHVPSSEYEELVQTTLEDSESNNECKSVFQSIRAIIKSLNLSIFRQFSFLRLMVFQAIDSGSYGWIVYLVSLAESKGISPYLSAVIASSGGLGSMAGKMTTPLIIDRRILPTIVVYSILFFAMSIALVGHAIFNSFEGLLAVSFAFGFFSGALTVTIFKDCKTSVDGNQMAEALAWLEVASLVSSSIATILTGWLFDITGSYVASFIVQGMIPMIGVLTLSAEYVYRKN